MEAHPFQRVPFPFWTIKDQLIILNIHLIGEPWTCDWLVLVIDSFLMKFFLCFQIFVFICVSNHAQINRRLPQALQPYKLLIILNF